MGLLNSTHFIDTSIKDVSMIDNGFREHFEAEGYKVSIDSIPNQAFYSITKGGIFKQISGLKTGLNIDITREGAGIKVSMKIGLFSKQVIPAAIGMFVFWPVLIPEIIGIVEQSKLDIEALSVINDIVAKIEGDNNSEPNHIFCTSCGSKIRPNVKFCPDCGMKINEDKTCPVCGASVDVDATFCTECGTKL